MATRLLPLVLVVLLAATAAAQTRPAPTPPGNPAQSEHMRAGIAHFERAFYELTPQRHEAEARTEFDRAIAAFDRELAARPASPEAHRYLARIHAVRHEFRTAAAHYDKVAALEPTDVDACILAALAYVDAREPAEARARLVDAKLRTLDPTVLARLDEYIAKVDALNR